MILQRQKYNLRSDLLPLPSPSTYINGLTECVICQVFTKQHLELENSRHMKCDNRLTEFSSLTTCYHKP